MKSQSNNHHIEVGFTLIEVLVSVAILATGLVLILRAYTTAIVAMDVSDEVVRASLLIDEKMGDVELGLTQDGCSLPVLDGPFTAGDFSGDIKLKELARVDATSSTVVRVDVTLHRESSGHHYGAATCFNVVDRP
jgi:prepilin-type N-terminal cleavage/methylation domain-containing protein